MRWVGHWVQVPRLVIDARLPNERRPRGCSAELTAEAVPWNLGQTKKPGMQGGLGEWVPCFGCAMTAPLI